MKTKATVEWITCTGEAHENPYIDNCMVCMPYWGNYPICSIHKMKLEQSGYCKKGKHFVGYIKREGGE